MIDPQVIAKRLREQREITKQESSSLTEQLALVDYLLPDLSNEDRSKICGGNAEKLFFF